MAHAFQLTAWKRPRESEVLEGNPGFSMKQGGIRGWSSSGPFWITTTELCFYPFRGRFGTMVPPRAWVAPLDGLWRAEASPSNKRRALLRVIGGDGEEDNFRVFAPRAGRAAKVAQAMAEMINTLIATLIAERHPAPSAEDWRKMAQEDASSGRVARAQVASRIAEEIEQTGSVSHESLMDCWRARG
jgi:hypothetical protein